MLRFAVAMTLILAVGIGGSLAQDNASASQADATEAQTTPWYSLFGDNRADRFSQLRTKRNQLSKRLSLLETEVKDLRQKNVALDEARAVKRAANRTEYDYPPSGPETMLEERERLVFDNDQKAKEIEDSISVDRERLAQIEKQPTRSPDEEDKLEALRLKLIAGPKAIERQQTQAAFNLKQLEQRIQRAKDSAADWQAARERLIAEENASNAELQAQIDANRQLIDQKVAEIGETYSKIDETDAQIMQLIDVGDADGWFKIIISLSFALLVAGVIIGFFLVIGGHRSIIYEIFSNDSGIQFITIFSIVIAVILFGIIGVLEGKELAALLGDFPVSFLAATRRHRRR